MMSRRRFIIRGYCAIRTPHAPEIWLSCLAIMCKLSGHPTSLYHRMTILSQSFIVSLFHYFVFIPYIIQSQCNTNSFPQHNIGQRNRINCASFWQYKMIALPFWRFHRKENEYLRSYGLFCLSLICAALFSACSHCSHRETPGTIVVVIVVGLYLCFYSYVKGGRRQKG